jgi:hypothetical protein
VNWQFWKQEPGPNDVTKERLLEWREQLIKSAYALRVLDRITARYMWDAKDSASVKEVLRDAWIETTPSASEIWSTIGSIESVLSEKYGVFLLSSPDLQRLMLDVLEMEIESKETTHA